MLSNNGMCKLPAQDNTRQPDDRGLTSAQDIVYWTDNTYSEQEVSHRDQFTYYSTWSHGTWQAVHVKRYTTLRGHVARRCNNTVCRLAESDRQPHLLACHPRCSHCLPPPVHALRACIASMCPAFRCCHSPFVRSSRWRRDCWKALIWTDLRHRCIDSLPLQPCDLWLTIPRPWRWNCLFSALGSTHYCSCTPPCSPLAACTWRPATRRPMTCGTSHWRFAAATLSRQAYLQCLPLLYACSV